MASSVALSVQGRTAQTSQPFQIRSWRLLALKVVFFSALTLIGGELVSRAFWVVDRGAPFLSPNSLWYAFYPQLLTTGVQDPVISNTDATYDILILGGSTISDGFGNIGTQLKEALQNRWQRPVRVFNLAFAAHNSRDSMLKHRWLAKQRFDLVVVYDGINDARMNNAPPGTFRDDYAHCTWYKHLNYLDTHPALSHIALPFTLLHTADRLAEVTDLVWYLPRLNPRDEWMDYGKDVRTAKPYQQNLHTIVDFAKTKGERVLLMTFAYHIPANYSLAAYKAKQVDYASSLETGAAVEIYGKPEYVSAAIDEQNEAVRGLAAEHSEVVFIDQVRLMPRNGKIFYDCCHFTGEGCTLFTQNMVAALDVGK